MAAEERAFDPVHIEKVGSALVGLEGGVATASGAVIIMGWMLDPNGDAAGMMLDFNGRSHPVEVIDRTSRWDVINAFKAIASSRSTNVGFVGLAFVDPAALAGGKHMIALSFPYQDTTGVSRNKLLYEPGGSFQNEVLGHVPTRTLRGPAIQRIADAVLAPEAARVQNSAAAGCRRFTSGPEGRPKLSIIFPVTENTDALRHTLAYLEMDPDSDDIEVILPLTRPWLQGAARNMVARSVTSIRTVVVASDEDLYVSGAARIGVQAAQADKVVLISDEIVPPSGGWIAEVLDALDRHALCLPVVLPQFDGRVRRFEPHPLNDGDLSAQHDDVREAIRFLIAGQGLEGWSPGLVAARKGALLNADLDWSGYFISDYFWTDLLGHAVARGDIGVLHASERFTRSPTHYGHLAPPEHRLLDSYLLHSRLSALPSPGFEGAST